MTPQRSTPGYTRLSVDPKFLESIVAGKYIPPNINKSLIGGKLLPLDLTTQKDIRFCLSMAPKDLKSYKDRFRPGYKPYSYFFPPNDPEAHIPLMPLMVPPTKYKLYEEFAHVLDPLWELALESLSNSKNVFVIGYSLPNTDTRSLEMFRNADSAGRPNWIIVNPYPDSIVERLVKDVGIDPKRIDVETKTFHQFLDH